jgi:putative aldouronate transport system permease protein
MSTSETLRPAQTQHPPAKPAPGRRRREKSGSWRRAFRRDWQLYTLAILPLLFFLIFRYAPMIGNVIAFRKFEPGGSIFGEEWVGLRYVNLFLNDPTFWNVFTNTLILGALTLIFCFPLPIVLALLLNEVRRRTLKRFLQSVTYLPHFLSMVIVAGMVMQITSLDGPINTFLDFIGSQKISFMQDPDWFRTIYVSSEVWQTVGWGTILYLAALTTIDDQLYEAADLARDAARHPADGGHAADPQHRHVHGGGLREGLPALQPADLPDGRRHLDVPVPDGP